jgi:hypothetical protein
MLGIGEYSGRRSMVMRSSGHISLEPTLEGPECVLHHRLRLHGVFAGTLHPQSGSIVCAEDYCADTIERLPRIAGRYRGPNSCRQNARAGRPTACALPKARCRSRASVSSFTETSKSRIDAPYVTVCLESIECVRKEYELVIINEVQSVITHSNLPYIKHASPVSLKLETVITHAKNTILMDAATDSTAVKIVVDRLEELRGCCALCHTTLTLVQTFP